MLYCTRKFYGVREFGFEQLNVIAASPTATQENPGVETRLEILNLRGKLGGVGNLMLSAALLSTFIIGIFLQTH